MSVYQGQIISSVQKTRGGGAGGLASSEARQCTKALHLGPAPLYRRIFHQTPQLQRDNAQSECAIPTSAYPSSTSLMSGTQERLATNWSLFSCPISVGKTSTWLFPALDVDASKQSARRPLSVAWPNRL
jgi:hypothetical protein